MEQAGYFCTSTIEIFYNPLARFDISNKNRKHSTISFNVDYSDHSKEQKKGMKDNTDELPFTFIYLSCTHREQPQSRGQKHTNKWINKN